MGLFGKGAPALKDGAMALLSRLALQAPQNADFRPFLHARSGCSYRALQHSLIGI